MGALTNLEIGSVVVTLLEGIPAAISGLTATLVNNNVYLAESITGENIPINSIAEAYQPGITSLTIGNVLGLMESQGIGTKSVKIGELSISKGINESSSQSWRDLGISQLNNLGEKTNFYQTFS